MNGGRAYAEAKRGEDSLPPVKPIPSVASEGDPERSSFLACLASVIECRPAELPPLADREDPATGLTIPRWLGSLGLGLVPVADPGAFTWPGPWIARIQPPAEAPRRFVVMFGVPSGAVWDPVGDGEVDREWVTEGYLVAAGDIALARPRRPDPPRETGRVELIWVAPSAGEPAIAVEEVRALPGRGLEGDRHVSGRGTFPSGLSGSALTLIDAAVCEGFEPALSADEHRRNLVTRGIDLNRLVGHEFAVGEVRCRGMRLCEPCTVMERYAGRPVLRDLVHRGGLRADVLEAGTIHTGDEVRARL